MSDPYGPSPYGPSDRRDPPGPRDHHAENRDAWGDEPRGHRRLPEPHGPTAYGDDDGSYDSWGSDGLPIRRAGEPTGSTERYGQAGGYDQAGGYEQADRYGQAGVRQPTSPYATATAYQPATGYEPEPPDGGRSPGRSSRLVMGGAAAAVVLVLVAGAAVFTMRGKGPDPSDAALNRGAATTAPAAGESAAAEAYPSSGPAKAKPSPSGSTSAGKAVPGKTTTGKTTPSKSSGGAGGGGGVPAPPAGFTLTFADAFAGAAGSGLSSKYRYDTGPGSKFGTGEIETMTDSSRNVFHDGDGHLVLKAVHQGSDPGRGWTSGRFETQSDAFGAAKGGKVRMQASIEQPNVSRSTGAGYWPAFWMLGNGLRNGGTWPKIGEVDILEDVNGRSSVFGTLHCGTSPGGPCGESSGIGSGEKACAGCQTGFHTYAVEIDRSSSPEKIRWFLDGRTYFTLSQDRVDGSTWSNAVDHPFFIIFDLAMGGGFPDAFGGGPNSSTVSGGQMKIDYLAVYNS
jgi:beta-glucanase (GH16 family)